MANTKSIDLELSSSQYLSDLTPSADLGIDGDISLEMLVKFESVPTVDGDQQIIIMHGNPTGSYYDYLLMLRKDAVLGLTLAYFHRNSSDEGERVEVVWTPSTGVWYKIGITIATNTVKFYVGSSQQGENQTLSYTRTVDAGADLYIGSLWGTGHYYDGLMDEIRISDTIRTITVQTKEFTTDANTMGLWHLNNSLVDATGNGNTLTNNNSATFSTDVPFVGSSIKSINGLAKASIKSRNGLAIASIKSINGLE